jgi:hypothetical protein
LEVFESEPGLIGDLRSVDELGEEDDFVSRREVFAFVKDGERRIGAVQALEYQTSFAIDQELFLELMDRDCGGDAELSSTLVCLWDDFIADVADLGPIIELRAAHIEAGTTKPGLLRSVVESALKRLSDFYSIVVTKAFPMEYENRRDRGLAFQQCFERRRSAMQRYYKQVFGVIPVASSGPDAGWMWRPNERFKDDIPNPSIAV